MTSPERVLDIGIRVTGLDSYTQPDGRTLLAFAHDGAKVNVVDADSNEVVHRANSATDVRFLPSGRLVYADQHAIAVDTMPSPPYGAVRMPVGDDEVVVLDVMSEHLNEYVVAGGGRSARMINPGTGDVMTSVTGQANVLSIAASGSLEGFAAGFTDGRIIVHSAHPWAPEEFRQGYPVHDLAMFGEYAASTSGTDIVLWFLRTGARLGSLTGHETEVRKLLALRVHNRELLVSASQAGTVRVWDLETRQVLRQFVPETGTLGLASFTGWDTRPRLAVAGEDGIIRIYDLDLGTPSRIGTVNTRGFGDRVATTDLLGRGAFVAALTDALKPAANDEGPTVITVEGAWGSGKSTLLEFVKRGLGTPDTDPPRQRRLTVAGADRMLRRAEEPSTPDPIPPEKSLVVTFNPWRHQSSEQVWAGLATAVTDTATQVFGTNERERYWFSRNALRIDRRHMQRDLWKRIRSPLLSLGMLGLGVSLIAQLAKLALPWPWLVTAALVGAGVVHTGIRYFGCRASAFLPGELFAGPVRSNAFAGAATDPSIRDPYYHARSGYLYLVQHDVTELLRDLAARGYQLVVLVDDLDRCTPRTTAEVFEAINVFLSDALPRTRFVLGLDPAVVASHVDHAYHELADAKAVTHPDDPSPGWTFLRKLVQLPMRLPRTTADNVGRLLHEQLGPMHQERAKPTPVQAPRHVPSEVFEPSVVQEQLVVAPEVVETIVIAIERHPQVRAELHRRLSAQPENSVREEKRLINVWQFYLRVLTSADIEQACHLVAVAEIVTRWPAYQHLLRRNWQTLADAVDDDVAWGAMLAKAGFKHADERAAGNLRALLRDCDAQAVAKLAERLL